jgi:hypothetical protein
LLVEKAEKFEKDCNGDYRMFNLYCQRRAKHIYRSMMFLSKSQDSKFVEGMSEEEKAADAAIFEQSLTFMEKFTGENAEYVVMLKEKLIARGDAGVNAIKEVIALLTKLLQGTDEEQEEARNTIENMNGEKQELTEDEKAEQEQMLKNLAEHEEEIQNALKDRAAELDPEDEQDNLPEVDEEADGLLEVNEEAGNGENATALVQSNGELSGDNVVVTIVKGIVFIIVTFLVVAAIIWAILAALGFLLSFVLVILIGCACYDLGSNNGRLRGSDTFNCIAEIFKWPIVTGGNALEWYFDEFTPREFK